MKGEKEEGEWSGKEGRKDIGRERQEGGKREERQMSRRG